MLKKSYSRTGKSCRVTFKLPAEVKARKAVLCGEFNNWDKKAEPMKRLKDGSFSATLSLLAPGSYRFRYLLDGERWENDWEADAYVPNEFGSDDSVVKV
jgi:1,4-alpha-glucan branching enzyme